MQSLHYMIVQVRSLLLSTHANFSRDDKSYTRRKENGPIMHLEHKIITLITLAGIVIVYTTTQTGSLTLVIQLTP